MENIKEELEALSTNIEDSLEAIDQLEMELEGMREDLGIMLAEKRELQEKLIDG